MHISYVNVSLVCVVQFDVPASDVSEDDGRVTLEIKKTEKIDFDFDVIIIAVPLTAGGS